MPRQPSPSSPRHWAWSRSPAPHRHAPRTIAACERTSRADPGRNTCCCYAAADTPRPALPRPRHPDHRRGRLILEATRVGRVARGDRSPPGDGGRGALRTLGRGCPRTVVCGRVSSARRRGFGQARSLHSRRGGSRSPAMNFKLRIAIRLALGVALAVTAIARAAHGETPSAPAAAALTPPKLVTFVDAVYPAAAKAADAGEIVNVDLELTIDATGAVTEVHVATPVGDGFDEAALAAARRFVIEPARRGTQAIPARIKYRYAFQPPLAAPPPPTTGALEGRVLVRGADRPAVDTVVTVIGAGGEAHTAVTGPEGTFTFAALPPGKYRVQLAAKQLNPLSAEEEISAGDLTSVTYRLGAPAPAASEDGALEYGATATDEAPARETPKRTLEASELLNLAGTRGDPLRGIEYMPGVARAPLANFVIIRGASPADSDVLLDGAPVFRLYHNDGLTSI